MLGVPWWEGSLLWHAATATNTTLASDQCTSSHKGATGMGGTSGGGGMWRWQAFPVDQPPHLTPPLWLLCCATLVGHGWPLLTTWLS